ncbi:DUF397 domain-containing protein [Streptomyces sp. NPDC021212]|uniref:DUF397 domain-containing protein n=1 Tax=Streptomyces sp. NPDC021212 TaxID=3365118 RepID=UPI003792CB4B
MREPCISERGWFKSSYSGAGNTECVETTFTSECIAVRDSKATDGPVLRFSRIAWSTFLTAARKGHWGKPD